MPIPPLLDSLLRAHGPSGHEHLAYDAVREGLAGVAEIETDTVGNLIAREPGATGPPPLALFAHIDIVGLSVMHVADDGLVLVNRLVPHNPAIAHGQRVEIHTANGPVHGVIARRLKDAEKVEWDQLYVDIGARDGEDGRSLVAAGDPMVAIAPPLELANGRIVSRNVDNRAGLYVALETMRRLAGEETGIAVVAGAHEELGAQGARVAAYTLRPGVAIAIDVTYATDTPAGDVAKDGGDHRLGGGPALFRGPTIHPRVHDLLVEAARAAEIDHTIEIGTRTNTDADEVFDVAGGIPTGVVSIPLRNMHSTIEMIELADLEACVELLVAFARNLDPGLDFRR